MKKLLFILLIINVVYAQKKDPDAILEQVIENFNSIQDYQVGVQIKVDVDFIKVPDMQATLYFKQPDRMHLDSEKFAMLPKSGMSFSPTALLKGDYTSFYEKEDEVNGIKTSVIKIIPLGNESDVVLSTLWIDLNHYRIIKVESTTKTQGTYSIELNYGKEIKYPLPASMVFSFNVEKMNLPKGMDGELNTSSKETSKDKMSKGKVIVEYSGYKVNKGIPDEVFTEEKK